MLIMVALSMVINLMGMAVNVVFYATAAYWVAKMSHKGWIAGKK